MRVAINASIVDECPTGLGIYSISVIRALDQIVSDSDVFTIYTGYPDAFSGLRMHVRPLRKWTRPRYGKAGGLYRFLWTQTSFAAQIRIGQYDLVYHTTHHGFPYALDRTPQVLTMQNDVGVNFRFPPEHRLQHYYFRYFVPRLLEASAAIITTSEYAKRTLSETYGTDADRIVVAYNGYNHEIFTPDPTGGDGQVLRRYGLAGLRYMLVVGATYAHKNIDRLLAAFAEVRAIHRDVCLCIAGFREAYLRRILADVANDIREAVTTLPYVPQSDLAALYRAAICLVFPSLHESFGIPCIEAMASGCPVITSAVSSLPEVCADASLFVDPYRIADMVSALRRVIENEQLRATLRQKGLERAQRFRWQATAEVVYEVLRRVHQGIAATSSMSEPVAR